MPVSCRNSLAMIDDRPDVTLWQRETALLESFATSVN